MVINILALLVERCLELICGNSDAVPVYLYEIPNTWDG
jgi:hypothetical protein